MEDYFGRTAVWLESATFTVSVHRPSLRSYFHNSVLWLQAKWLPCGRNRQGGRMILHEDRLLGESTPLPRLTLKVWRGEGSPEAVLYRLQLWIAIWKVRVREESGLVPPSGGTATGTQKWFPVPDDHTHQPGSVPNLFIYTVIISSGLK